MKIILALIASTLVSCVTTTTTAPDGSVTVTRAIDLPAFTKGADVITTIVTSSGK